MMFNPNTKTVRSVGAMLVLLLIAIANVSAYPSAEAQSNIDEMDDLIDPAILGGTNAANGQYPSMVSLQTLGLRHFCGGVIVNTQWALTAAHCVANREPTEIRVRSGTLRHNQGGRVHAVHDIRVHELYQAAVNRYNDIAAVRIVGQFTQNQMTRPIVIDARSSVSRIGSVAIGWGRMRQEENRLAATLQQLRTTVLSDQECVQQADIPVVARVQICTLAGIGRGKCAGDTGGPLIADGRLIGLSSSAVPCAQGIPDVYTRVSVFHAWIVETVGPVRRA